MEAGLAPDLVWDMSFREYRAAMAGAVGRLKRAHNERAWLAWHIAMLTRIKAEKFPRLKTMLHGAERPERRQSVEHQIGIARQWAALSSKR